MPAIFQTSVTRIALVSALTIPASIQAATFTVENTSESGSGSLREAISNANNSAGADTIEFADAVAGTITLSSALPQVTDDVEIAGPGAELLTVSGNGTVRPFSIASGVQATISDLTIAEGFAVDNGNPGNGGGIRNQGMLTLLDCAIRDNVAATLGGGIDNFGSATLRVERCTITGNSADIGGGISNDGTLTAIDSTVINNQATTLGGGIDNSGEATVTRSLVEANTSQFGGGLGTGVAEPGDPGGDLRVVNSTLSGNSVSGDSATGGGIDNFNGSVELVHATIARNQAPDGGGVWTNNEFAAKNSLVVENTGGDCDFDLGTFEVFGTNLDTDGSCPNFSTVSPSQLALEDLADNGGPTATHALGSSSFALNAAPDCTGLDGTTPITEDQRGEVRPQGIACEPGAFESAAGDLIFADGFESQ